MEAAREGERLRAALIDSLTHELRTPLTADPRRRHHACWRAKGWTRRCGRSWPPLSMRRARGSTG